MEPGDSYRRPGVGPDLIGLQPGYRVHVSPRLRWTLSAAAAIAMLPLLLSLFGERDGFRIVLPLLQLLCFGLLLAFHLWLPVAVFIEPDGLRFRRFLVAGRLIRWREIRELQVQGRWQENSRVVLAGGETLVLAGMPVQDAQRLADAVERWRSR